MIKNRPFKIAASIDLVGKFSTEREIVSINEAADFTLIAAVVLSSKDINISIISELSATGLPIPIIAFLGYDEAIDSSLLSSLTAVFNNDGQDSSRFNLQLEAAALKYESELSPPFFKALTSYMKKGNITYACPGHQGSDYFYRHPAGRKFVDLFGENIFLADVPHADPMLGELLSHGGVPGDAQAYAASVFNADKTYFVLNGTSASNKVVTNAILTPGDVVLFDRNNHKSCYHGALLQAGATPLYLETCRNAYGLIGGIPARCFSEDYLRQRLKTVAPEMADASRPFRLAIFQQGTCDGTIYNAKEMIKSIGHLCDYILFDSAWVGYEQFIPMMQDCSPMLSELSNDDPGIIVTQSVHKQLAGFSQCSQIHKKDKHIKGQERYCNHKRFNHAFMLNASTSPFYPLFAALEINAKMHSGKDGQRLWQECVRLGIEARKTLLSSCSLIKPFVPESIDGMPWQSFDTEIISNDRRFFNYAPNEPWHNFLGYSDRQYMVDPCKLLLITPGIDSSSGDYYDFGIPAIFLAYYLRDNGIVPEKSELNSIVFLLTPAVSYAKLQFLVSLIIKFEKHITENSLLSEVLPSLCSQHPERYRHYRIRQLCQEMHDLYAKCQLQKLQRDMFIERNLPPVALLPQKANIQFVKGDVDLILLEHAEGRVAAEAALPYPPGIVCIAPGERWTGAVLSCFMTIQTMINLLPEFAPGIQGVYIKKDIEGKHHLYCYVLKGPH